MQQIRVTREDSHRSGSSHRHRLCFVGCIAGAGIAAAVLSAKMKYLEALPAHNHDGDNCEQHGNHDEDQKRSPGVIPRITEPCQLVDQRLRVGRRADRLPNFGSLAPGDLSARLALNSRSAN